MKTAALRKYLLNCFLLILPALAVNLAWAGRLPPMWRFGVFWRDIPPVIAYVENITRLVVNVLPVFMPLRVAAKGQRTGLVVYVLGMLLYVSAWVLLVYFPENAWSTSLVGSTAAAWTTLIWLVGIGLIGDSLFLPIPYRRWWYVLASVIFAVFHTWHAAIVYLRLP